MLTGLLVASFTNNSQARPAKNARLEQLVNLPTRQAQEKLVSIRSELNGEFFEDCLCQISQLSDGSEFHRYADTIKLAAICCDRADVALALEDLYFLISSDSEKTTESPETRVVFWMGTSLLDDAESKFSINEFPAAKSLYLNAAKLLCRPNIAYYRLAEIESIEGNTGQASQYFEAARRYDAQLERYAQKRPLLLKAFFRMHPVTQEGLRP